MDFKRGVLMKKKNIVIAVLLSLLVGCTTINNSKAVVHKVSCDNIIDTIADAFYKYNTWVSIFCCRAGLILVLQKDRIQRIRRNYRRPLRMVPSDL